MKKYFSFIFLFLISFVFLLGGCGNENTSGDIMLPTTYPENFKIVVRENTDTTFSEQTFAVSNGVYYYKYQEYTTNFESIGSTMVQYVGVKSGSDFNAYNYNEISGWNSILMDFNVVWQDLDTYYSTIPNFVFRESEKQADSEVNGTPCYTYIIANNTYKISKDQYHIEWYFNAENMILTHEVQSFTTTNCFADVPILNLPNA